MKTSTTTTLDRYEYRILDALQSNGRLTNQELSEMVGLSASPCWRRTKALEDGGYVRRYTAILDRRKLGFGECIFAIVSLDRHRTTMVASFESTIVQRPEVLECHAVSGDGDYLLKILAASNEDYYRFIQETIFRMEGVVNVRSSISLGEIKSDTRVPIRRPEG